MINGSKTQITHLLVVKGSKTYSADLNSRINPLPTVNRMKNEVDVAAKYFESFLRGEISFLSVGGRCLVDTC